MRIMIALLIAAALTVPTLAAGWGHYSNERFGIEVDIPPDFVPGAPPANGDGLRFSTPTAELAVFGSLILEGGFEREVAQRLRWASDDGWAITYQATTPSWASWSGKKGSRILYVRAISMCGGSTIGAFEFEYSEADVTAFDPIIERLVRSLGNSGSGWQC